MSAQYLLFDAQTLDEKRDLDIALGAPPDILPATPPRSWRGPARGMRFLKLGLADGSSIVVETTLSMFELSSELHSKAKVALTLADGRGVEIRIQDVAYLENMYRMPCLQGG